MTRQAPGNKHKPPVAPMERRQHSEWRAPRKRDRTTRLVPMGLIGFITVLSITLIYVIVVRGPDTHTGLGNRVPAGYTRTEPQFVMLYPEPTLAPTPTPTPPPTPTPTAPAQAPGATTGPDATPTATPAPTATPTARTMSFSQDVLPALKVCQTCHSESVSMAGVTLTSYQALTQSKLPLVAPGKPDESLLIGVLQGKPVQMPPSGPLSSEQIEAIRAWIAQGAQNN